MMARNHVYDSFKKLAYERAGKLEAFVEEPTVNDADGLLLEKQYQQLLQETLDKLPPQQQKVYRLAREENMSHQEIADKLKISRLTVKTHMAKALNFIRQRLQQHIELYIFVLLFFK